MKHLLASNGLLLPPLLLLILLFLINRTSLTRAQIDREGFIESICRPEFRNYTSGSQYESNLINNLLPSLVANGSITGFLTTSFGEAPDIVYGLVQCRGDISPQECRACLSTSSVKIKENCTNRAAASRQNDFCLLRYAPSKFFPTDKDYNKELDYSGGIANPGNVRDPDRFNNQLDTLMKNLISRAIEEPSMFATGSIQVNEWVIMYGLVQCTRYLSPTPCSDCLTSRLKYIQNQYYGKIGGRAYVPNCYVRFEDYLFFKLSLQPPPPTLNVPPQPNDGKKNVAIIVLATLLLLVSLLCVYFLMKKTRRRRSGDTTDTATITAGMDIKTEDYLQYDLVTLVNATNNFSDAKKLGEGGYAIVYKGELQDGKEIAVKRLTNKFSVQGPQQFKNEVVLLHKLQHRNLVRLLGYCLEGEETILIYEFVPNGSLDKYLFDPLKKLHLDWGTRYKIIRGIARGLLYLHEDSRLRIIHRDLKAGNILLDEEMNVRIADFGTAKLFGVDQTTGNTSRITGTFGYMAPEYALHGLFSVKSDVFSFGVLLLEIVSGQKINSWHLSSSSPDLLSYAWKHWNEDTSIEFIDPTLEDNYSRNEVTRSIHVGLLCVQEDTKVRPTMSSVVNMLDNSFALAFPAQPTFFGSRSIVVEFDDPSISSSMSSFKRTGSNAVKREVESDDPSTTSTSYSAKGLSLDETNLPKMG